MKGPNPGSPVARRAMGRLECPTRSCSTTWSSARWSTCHARQRVARSHAVRHSWNRHAGTRTRLTERHRNGARARAGTRHPGVHREGPCQEPESPSGHHRRHLHARRGNRRSAVHHGQRLADRPPQPALPSPPISSHVPTRPTSESSVAVLRVRAQLSALLELRNPTSLHLHDMNA